MTLTTPYLGLKLAHPFILGASPVTGHLDNVRRAEDGGCAAIVMHSLFEEQIAETAARKLPGFEQAAREFLATLSHFSRPERFPLGPEEYLEQLRRIKAAVSVPVIGSLNGVGTDGWLTYARLIEEAGADALELNVYYLSTGVRDSSADIEAHIESLVRKLKGLIRIPIAVKLSPFFTAFGALAVRLEAAGADGLIFFNRYYQPDVDIESLETLHNVHLYFSMEVALEAAMPTYAGGPGVLAGDFVHAAADFGVLVVAVTLLHRKGYFRQRLDSAGRQHEEPLDWPIEEYLQPLFV